jgi:hypothetical protein
VTHIPHLLYAVVSDQLEGKEEEETGEIKEETTTNQVF